MITTKTKRITITLALLMAAVIVSVWTARGYGAAGETELSLSSFGLAAGQTARLTVMNRGKEPGPVIEWKFLDSQGRILTQTTERQRISSGEMKIHDLNFDEINAPRDRAGRLQLQGVIRALGGPDTKNLNLSLEIFDNSTGKTTVFLPSSVLKGFNPQPDPPAFQ